MQIRFGTDGWRGIDGSEFTGAGVETVSRALGHYIKESGQGNGVVIGFDCRKNSAQYAQIVSDTLTDLGVDVFMPGGHMPTPAAAFAVKHLGTDGAVMITASHNPSSYNGLKFIPDYAGPATNDITDQIEALLKTDLPSGNGRGKVRLLDIKQPYIDHLAALVGTDTMAGTKIVIDPLYGAARGYLSDALSYLGCKVVALHDAHDPDFGGLSPDPREENLGELKAMVKNDGNCLGVALDGDGDRLAACDASGRVYTANDILPLLYDYLLTHRGWHGGAARTVATTHWLDIIADECGEGVIETAVGFKHVGQALMRPDVVLAGEESGGLSVRGHVPDKDAVLGALMLTAMVADQDKDLSACRDGLVQRYGNRESIRFDLELEPDQRGRIVAKIDSLQPDDIASGDGQVVGINRLDGLKVEYDDGSWWLARPSGTEPVVRLYAEASDRDRAQARVTYVKQLLV